MAPGGDYLGVLLQFPSLALLMSSGVGGRGEGQACFRVVLVTTCLGPGERPPCVVPAQAGRVGHRPGTRRGSVPVPVGLVAQWGGEMGPHARKV